MREYVFTKLHIPTLTYKSFNATRLDLPYGGVSNVPFECNIEYRQPVGGGVLIILGVVLTKFYFSRVAGQFWKIFEKFRTKGFNEVFPALTGQGNNFEMPHAARIQ